jgi:PAS domain S-box-containing protein
LAVPVTVDDVWWGHMGFDDCISERDWSAGELDALRVAAGILSAAIGRQQAEANLRERDDLYRTLVEQIPAVVYVNEVATEWIPTYTSPRVKDLFGVSPREYRDGHLWMEFVHPEDRERVLAEDARTDATLEPFDIEYRMVLRDGRTVWIRDLATVVSDAEGEPRFWSGVMFDITELKRAEEELARALGIEQEASARLRALDDMKNTFLQAVSHDLRTPLAAVLGSALTLDREDIDLSDVEAKDLIHRMALNAQKLQRLINDLLDLDRLSRGLLEPNRTEHDVTALIRLVVESSALLADRNISVEGGPVFARIDGPKVERIVENLLVNAARHTPEGSQTWVRLAPEEGGGVLISVEDDGPGVRPELRQAIFGAFERGPSSSAHAPGSGVGLTLVARFAELHGGRAWVEERVGGGASFNVLLPGTS